MKQVFMANDGIRIEDVPPPICQDNELLVQTCYSVISSGTETSDLHREGLVFPEVLSKQWQLLGKVKNKITEEGVKDTLRSIRDRITGQAVLQSLTPKGYSLSGIVIEKGKAIRDLNVGDRVACAGSGIANHAEIVSVPRNLVARIPENVSNRQAAFTTIASISMHGVRRAESQFGETIVILGLGLLGLLGVQIAKAAGCKVIGIEIEESRLEIARSLGVDLTLNLSRNNVEKEVSEFTSGIGADAVIIFAGTKSSEPALLGARLCRKKARIVVVGNVGMDLEREEMYKKEIDLVMSTSYGPGRYDSSYEEKGIDYPIGYVRWTENRNMEEVLRMISEGRIDVERLISLEFPIDEAPRAYEAILSYEPKPLGVVINYPNSSCNNLGLRLQRKSLNLHKRVSSKSDNNAVNIGVIGAGDLAQRVHLPNIIKIRGFNLRAVVCRHGERAKALARKFGAEYATTDFKEVLADDDVDAVLIATRHNLHALMTIEAAKAGKHVFVEKPMVLNPEELKQIQEIIGETGIKYTVGFNRRYSSLVLRARDLLSKIKRPYLITYRVNAGSIPKSNWVHDPTEGGGRIIGECCHFFDLFNYLVDSEIEDVVVKNIPTNGINVVADDNFISTITYSDGSLAVLIYTSTGSKSLPKERIEIFGDGTSIVIDDFKRIEHFGNGQKNLLIKKEDKGHYNELIEFLKVVRGEPCNCLTLEEAAIATEITFKIVDMIGRKQVWEQEGEKS